MKTYPEIQYWANLINESKKDISVEEMKKIKKESNKEKINEALKGQRGVCFNVAFKQSSGPYAGTCPVLFNANSMSQAIKKLQAFIKKYGNSVLDDYAESVIVYEGPIDEKKGVQLSIAYINDENGSALDDISEFMTTYKELFGVAGELNIHKMLEATSDSDFMTAKTGGNPWDLGIDIVGEY